MSEATQRCRLTARDWKRVSNTVRRDTLNGRSIVDKIREASISRMPESEIVGIAITHAEYQVVQQTVPCMTKASRSRDGTKRG